MIIRLHSIDTVEVNKIFTNWIDFYDYIINWLGDDLEVEF